MPTHLGPPSSCHGFSWEKSYSIEFKIDFFKKIVLNLQETPRKLVNMYLSKYLLLNGYSNQINT